MTRPTRNTQRSADLSPQDRLQEDGRAATPAIMGADERPHRWSARQPLHLRMAEATPISSISELDRDRAQTEFGGTGARRREVRGHRAGIQQTSATATRLLSLAQHERHRDVERLGCCRAVFRRRSFFLGSPLHLVRYRARRGLPTDPHAGAPLALSRSAAHRRSLDESQPSSPLSITCRIHSETGSDD